MSAILAKYDSFFAKQIASLAALLMANFVCAVAITMLMDHQDPATKAIVQMAMIAAISILSCLVLLRMNNSRRVAAQAIGTLVVKDGLTGLPNRDIFQTHLTQRSEGTLSKNPFVLMLFDINRFKELNATLGQKGADLILCEIANRLAGLAEMNNDAARISGDEFALIVPYSGSEQDLEHQMRKVFDTLYQPCQSGKRSLELTMCTGITLYPDDSEEADGLRQNAQFALQRAKQKGQDSICCYDEVADPQMMDAHWLSQDMERAFQQREFKLYFQPQHDFSTGEQSGFEVLLRWHHRERGVISPAVFIPIAEQNGMILKLSEYLIQEACEIAAGWLRPWKVAVNLSPVQLREPGIGDHIVKTLHETGLDAWRLELEVTESLFIDINDEIKADLLKLQKLGISIALDDFGTGYSSLSYLTSYPFDKIKIDQSFVRDLSTNDGNMAIISAIIGMAKSLDMKITAEGIEDQASYEMLRIAGCDQAQGYLLGKPRDIALEPGNEVVAEEATAQAIAN